MGLARAHSTIDNPCPSLLQLSRIRKNSVLSRISEMWLGPIFTRELITCGRRSGTYRTRAGIAVFVAALIAANVWGWYLEEDGRFTPQGMIYFAQATFGTLAAVMFGLLINLTPGFVGRGLAEDKERGTLGYVLVTRLSSAEIVLGKLGSGLLLLALCLAAVLPMFLGIALLGKLDPLLAEITCAAGLSSAYVLGGSSIAAAVKARTAREAVRTARSLAAVWVGAPLAIWAGSGWMNPTLYTWIRPINEWLLASGPIPAAMSAAGLASPVGFLPAFFWMVGLQLGGGSLLVAWSILRLRACSRDLEGGDSRVLGRRLPNGRPRLRAHPPVGDDPVYWKEIHVSRSARGLMRVFGVLVMLGLLGGVGYGTYTFAVPAFEELLVEGYGVTGGSLAR